MTIERQIAGKAKDLVDRQKEGAADHPNETAYRSLCESFPALLRGAGLARAAAFLKAKSKSSAEYGKLYDHLEDQFRNLGLLRGVFSEQVADPGLSLADYRLYSEVSMLVALWHKRLAQAKLRKKGEK